MPETKDVQEYTPPPQFVKDFYENQRVTYTAPHLTENPTYQERIAHLEAIESLRQEAQTIWATRVSVSITEEIASKTLQQPGMSTPSLTEARKIQDILDGMKDLLNLTYSSNPPEVDKKQIIQKLFYYARTELTEDSLRHLELTTPSPMSINTEGKEERRANLLSLTHDVRNPLTVIIAGLQLAERLNPRDPKRYEYIDRAKKIFQDYIDTAIRKKSEAFDGYITVDFTPQALEETLRTYLGRFEDGEPTHHVVIDSDAAMHESGNAIFPKGKLESFLENHVQNVDRSYKRRSRERDNEPQVIETTLYFDEATRKGTITIDDYGVGFTTEKLLKGFVEGESEQNGQGFAMADLVERLAKEDITVALQNIVRNDQGEIEEIIEAYDIVAEDGNSKKKISCEEI